jgi:hypothetical protein
VNYAWDIFKQYAPHNPNLADFRQFEHLVERLKAKQPFQIARYNDGEWIFTLQIEPYYTRCITAHNHDPQEVAEISKKMLSVIDSRPPYYIGIDSSTLALTGSILPVKNIFLEKIAPLNTVYGEIFNAATVMYGIDVLIKPLQDRWVLTVGPEYMKKLKISENHVAVPLNNCWNQVEPIQKQIQEILAYHLDKKPVIVYSCSMLAKWLIDVFYRQFGDAITQLDIGSCIDPWCGIVSRPWHNALLKTYGLHHRTKIGDYPHAAIGGYPQYGYTRNITSSTPRRAPTNPGPAPQPLQPIILLPPPPPPPPPPSKVIPVYKPKHNRDPNAPIVLPSSISTGKPAPRSGFK